jgi:hypothetical protein
MRFKQFCQKTIFPQSEIKHTLNVSTGAVGIVEAQSALAALLEFFRD